MIGGIVSKLSKAAPLTPLQLLQLLLAKLRPHFAITKEGKTIVNHETEGSYATALCYQLKNDFIIFYPVTDRKRHDYLAYIGDSVALFLANNPQHANKKLLFPIYENRFTRKHWVTLLYEPEIQKATLIDSNSKFQSFAYPTSRLKTALNAKIIEHIYQSIGHNEIPCGTQVATNVESLVSTSSTNDTPDKESNEDITVTIEAPNETKVKDSFYKRHKKVIWLSIALILGFLATSITAATLIAVIGFNAPHIFIAASAIAGGLTAGVLVMAATSLLIGLGWGGIKLINKIQSFYQNTKQLLSPSTYFNFGFLKKIKNFIPFLHHDEEDSKKNQISSAKSHLTPNDNPSPKLTQNKPKNLFFSEREQVFRKMQTDTLEDYTQAQEPPISCDTTTTTNVNMA
jgi:hypothetical protein